MLLFVIHRFILIKRKKMNPNTFNEDNKFIKEIAEAGTQQTLPGVDVVNGENNTGVGEGEQNVTPDNNTLAGAIAIEKTDGGDTGTTPPANTGDKENAEKGYIVAIKKSPEPEIKGVNEMKEDEVLQKLPEYLDALINYKKSNVEANKKIVDALNLYPEVRDFLRDIINGVPLEVAVSKNMPDVMPEEGDKYYEDAQKARKERIRRMEENQKYLKEIEDNIELTKKEIEQFKNENKLSEEEAVSFINDVSELLDNAMRGKLTKAILSKFYKAMRADTEKEAAVKKAIVDEKNKKIEVMKASKNDIKGDGLPKVNSTTKKTIKKGEPDEWTKAIHKTLKRKIL